VHAPIGDIDVRYRQQPSGHRDQQQKKHNAHTKNLSRKRILVNAAAPETVIAAALSSRNHNVAGETPTPIMLHA
jgi:hypothetical protein